MESVNIAALKAKLSFYLTKVRHGGELLVMDRKTPVARVVPSGPAAGLTLVPAKTRPSTLKAMKVRRKRRRVDVVALLREDRDRR